MSGETNWLTPLLGVSCIRFQQYPVNAGGAVVVVLLGGGVVELVVVVLVVVVTLVGDRP